MYCDIYIYIYIYACVWCPCLMFIDVGNEHDDRSTNPG